MAVKQSLLFSFYGVLILEGKSLRSKAPGAFSRTRGLGEGRLGPSQKQEPLILVDADVGSSANVAKCDSISQGEPGFEISLG